MQTLKVIVVFFVCGLLAACGSVPVPKRSVDADKGAVVTGEPAQTRTPTPKAPASEPERPSRAVAEEAKPRSAEPQATPDVEPEGEYQAESGLTAQEHIKTSLRFLQVGNAERAERELEAALAQEPDNRIAQDLLDQIRMDPDAYFAATDSFRYRTRRGDSLSTIAKEFLDDPLKFYALSKYNNIDKPSRLRSGSILNIPGEKPRPAEQPTPSRQASSEADMAYNLAKRYYDAGRFQDAIDLLEKATAQDEGDVRSRDLLVLAYTKYAETLAQKAELLEAETVLERALSMQPKNARLKDQLETIKSRRKADALYKNGVEALQAGSEDKASELFQQALELNPDHALARKQLSGLQGDLVASYHKKAMQLYRQQKLNEAIKTWDRVLSLDPNHELARLYRARALELKERIERLE